MANNEPIVSYRKVAVGSERSFGIVFAVVFAVVALVPLWRASPPRLWALAIAVVFLGLAFLAPRVLAPLNRVWHRIGLALHAIVNPIVMGLIYFGTIVPMGLLMRVFGKDPLRLKPEPDADSYWIVRDPPGPPRGSMTKQF